MVRFRAHEARRRRPTERGSRGAALVVVLGLLLLPFLSPTSSWGQRPPDPTRIDVPSAHFAPEAGQLFRRYVDPDTYGAHRQNWDATQDSSGVFYVANTGGILVYDGHTWQSVPTANRSIARSLAADEEGRVYVGAQRDFGRLRRDSVGQVRYVSLLDHVPESHRTFTDVWRTETTSTGVYFQSYRRLFRWQSDTNTMQSWAPDSVAFDMGGVARDTFFVGVPGRGLMTVQGDSLRRAPGGAFFADKTVSYVTGHKRYGLLVGTPEQMFVREGGTFRSLETTADDLLRSAWISKVTTRSDGSIVIGTIDKGLLLFGPEGDLRRRLRARNQPVPGVYADREGGLWALMDGGLLRYDLAAPFTEYGASVGLHGAVEDITRHRDTLYAATLEGTFRLEPSDDSAATFSRTAVNTQSWTLLSMGNELLVGTVNGLSVRGLDGTMRSLLEANHVYSLLRSRQDSSRVYVATGRGVRTITRTQTGWRVGTRVPKLDTEARTLAEADNGTLWVGTSFDGVYRIRMPVEGDSTVVDHFGTEHGLPPDRVDPLRWNERLVFGTSTGLLEFSAAPTPQFVPIASVEVPPAGRNGITRLTQDARGRTWGFTSRGPGRWTQRDTTWQWTPGGLHRLQSRMANVLWTEDQGRTLWFGMQDELIRYVPEASRLPMPPRVRIRQASTLEADSALSLREQASGPVLPTEQNGLRIRYGTPSLSRPAAVKYQYRLRGRTADWSSWTHRTEQTVANLAAGTYTFEVRARTAYGDTTQTARYTVSVLPPWYRTWWAYGLYGLCALGLVVGAVQWRTRRLRQRQRRLKETVAERTEEIESQKQQLAEQAERLKELDAAKSRFFANVSHEFRTPLTLIRGPVQQMRDRLSGRSDAPDPEPLAVAERNTDRLQRLIDQLLDLSRMEAGRYDLNARPTDVGGAAARIARSVKPLAEREGLTLTIEAEREGAAETDSPVYVDREALEHILRNLLTNAIKFTPEGGRVTITVRRANAETSVAVSDTGPGIPEQEKDTIFDRFEQAGSSVASRERAGVGIGLSFVNDLVELHGGTIRVDSEEGAGATFTVCFPHGSDHLRDEHIAEEKTTEDSGSSSAEASPPDRASFPEATGSPNSRSASDTHDAPVVLVVDDNADVRRYVRTVLEPEYRIVEAANGADGLGTARDVLPDCIVADVMMPGMDGLAMVQELKQEATTESIPVVLLTARAESAHEQKGLEAGADDYIAKPFDADVLRARVAGMISVRRRLRRRIREELQHRRGDGVDSAEGDGEGGADDANPPQLVVPTATANESAFVREVREAIEDHLADPDFSVDQLASSVAVSRSTLYRRLKDQIDCTPSQFIQEVRMEHGARLLREREGTISEVAYAVGFSSLSYFSRSFRKHFGQPPSEYVEVVG